MTAYLLFLLCGRVFGVRLQGAIEILPRRPLRAVPLSYSYVDGLLDYRGALYPVFNLARRLGMSQPAPVVRAGEEPEGRPSAQSIILLEEQDTPFGIVADGVVRMTRLEEQPAPPEKIEDVDPRYVKGLVSDEGQDVLILDFERLFHAG